jgi:hypothetical protein
MPPEVRNAIEDAQQRIEQIRRSVGGGRGGS